MMTDISSILSSAKQIAKELTYNKCTVETRYNEILGTEKFSLLYMYQIFRYINSKKTIHNIENIFIGTGKISLLFQVFCYIRSLYIECPLYRVSTVPRFHIPVPCECVEIHVLIPIFKGEVQY